MKIELQVEMLYTSDRCCFPDRLLKFELDAFGRTLLFLNHSVEVLQTLAETLVEGEIVYSVHIEMHLEFTSLMLNKAVLTRVNKIKTMKHVKIQQIYSLLYQKSKDIIIHRKMIKYT